MPGSRRRTGAPPGRSSQAGRSPPGHQAAAGSVAGAGGAVGLILGGFLTQDLSWRWTLYVNLVFAAIAVAGALVFIRGSKPASRPRIDVTGALLGGLGVFLIVFGFAHAETAGWSAALTVGSLAAGVLLIGAFGLAEGRVNAPLLPLRVILDRTRGGAYLSVGVAAIALFGALLFLTYYLQTVKGYSPVTTGLAFLPMVGGLLVSANASSNVLLPRIGPRILISSGLLTGAAAMACLTQLSVTSSYDAGVLPALILLGLGFGMILAPAINTATTGVRPQDSGVASALVNTMQQVGGSIGASALSTVALSAAASSLAAHHASAQAPAAAAVHGYTVAFTVSAILLAAGAVLVFSLLPSRRVLAERRGVAAPDATPAAAMAAAGSDAASTARAASPATCPAASAG